MIRPAGLCAVLLVAAPLLLGGCDQEVVEARRLPRASRFGILPDLVLHLRPARLGGPFFLDRFETTQGDWDRYLTETEQSLAAFADFDAWNEPADPTLPVVGIDQAAARTYAAWRFGRLPLLGEWEWAASAGGVYRLPWGDAERAAWANTQELGIARLTPVGAFESGRSPIGCYDLVGNAAEWTASPWPEWLAPEGRVRDAVAWFAKAPDATWRRGVLRAEPALWPWHFEGGAFPLAWLWSVSPRTCPVVAVAGFTRPLAGVVSVEGRVRSRADQLERRLPAERSSEIGVRVASDPTTLLRGLAAVRGMPTEAEQRMLRQFLARAAVREVLVEALARRPGLCAGEGAVAAILRAELGR